MYVHIYRPTSSPPQAPPKHNNHVLCICQEQTKTSYNLRHRRDFIQNDARTQCFGVVLEQSEIIWRISSNTLQPCVFFRFLEDTSNYNFPKC